MLPQHDHSSPTPPGPSRAWSFYLDFDGTLIDIAARPEAVVVPPSLPVLLDRVRQRAGGAVAIVTGRPIAGLDCLLHPLKFATAGQHGLERRDAGGRYHAAAVPEAALATVRDEFAGLAGKDPRLLVEDKGMSIALHFRQAPEREGDVEASATRLEALVGEALSLLHGKCVVEFRPRGTDKGEALRRFQQEAPYAGRLPVFIGDDVTDEDGFRAAADLGGFGIHVGTRPDTAARYRLAGVAAVHSWLDPVDQPEP